MCDAFDAMTSERPYAPAISEEAAIAELRRQAGTQFDPALVDLFAELHAFGSNGRPATVEGRPAPVS